MRTKFFCLMVVFVALMGIQIYAEGVPADVQAKLMLKIISMDRNFGRFGDPIKIGVSSDEMIGALKSTGMTISGKSFSAEKISSPDDAGKYKVVFIGKNMSGNASAITSKASGRQCLVFSESEDVVVSGGGAVSFKVVGSSPKIVVNLENAKKQGTDFPADFLKVTVVVGGLN
ncbi:MAG: YfiR family protein [Candidatus Omnitrophota bacterium]